MMRARLERHVGGRASRRGSGLPQREDLGVRPSCALMESGANDLAPSHQHAADRVEELRPLAEQNDGEDGAERDN